MRAGNRELPDEFPIAREWERVESGRVIERLTARTPDRFLLRTLFGLYPDATPFIQAFQQRRQIDSLFL